jgi:putative transposase
VSILCALFGLSKQAYYKKIETDGQKKLTFERAKRSVLDLRRQMPRLGTRKLHYLLKEKKIKVGHWNSGILATASTDAVFHLLL